MAVVKPKIWGTQDIVDVTGVDLDTITTLPNGGYVVTWRKDQKIAFQLYSGNGDKVGETQFVAEPIQPQWQPDVLTMPDGSFVITWTEAASGSAGGRTLRSQSFDIDGTPKGAAVTLNTTTQYDGAQTSLNGQNGWATAYVEDVGGTKSVRLVQSGADGAPGTPITISSVNGVDKPDVAWLGGTKHVVSYLTTGVNGGFTFSVVDNGVIRTGPPIANVVAADVVALENPDGTPSGEFVVVYDTGTGATSQVLAQKYQYDSATGAITAIGSLLTISSGTKPSAGDKVSVTALRGGGFAVAYVESTPGVDVADIWVRTIDKDGTIGEALRIHSDTGPQLTPAISEMADGRLSVSWYNPSVSTGGGSIDTVVLDARADKIDVVGTAGDDIYAPSEHVEDTLDGGSGIDTLTFKGADAGVALDLEIELDGDDIVGGGTAGIATGDTYKNFENVIGSAFNDTIVGSAEANRLEGGNGNDVLDGEAGDDTLVGGAGNDSLDGGADVDMLYGDAGDDVLNGGTETDTLVGGLGNDVLNGGAGIDTLNGDAGDDVLNGGTEADVMNGGAGNDVYYVDDAGDQIEESGAADGGTDTVYSQVTYGLTAFVENLIALGEDAINLTGNDWNNTIVGNVAANVLIGAAGNDTLNGGGGSDHLDGGEGFDLLYGGTGDDVLIGAGGNDNLNGDDGNDALDAGFGDDVVSGGTGNDRLDGGDGFDALYGGTGDDVLIGAGGNDNLNGDDGNDNLDGGDGDDIMNGGAGADVMNGGLGNDTYHIDNAGDVVIDSGGIDTVLVSVTYDISKLTTMENITGVGAVSITLTGNAFNNVLTGNDGANIIYGHNGNDRLIGGAGNDKIYGGNGRDVMWGGAGKDIFVFDKKPHKKHRDKIEDFNPRLDSFFVENKYFKVGKKGSIKKPKKLNKDMFYKSVKGNKAQDKEDRFIYDKKKGKLWYDADGIGRKKPIELAQLDKNLKITHKDFFAI